MKKIRIKNAKMDFYEEYLRFFEEEELLDYLGLESSSLRKYFKNELTSFLEGIGSDIVENEEVIPKTVFKFKLDLIYYDLGVTSIEYEEGNYKNFLWFLGYGYSSSVYDTYRFKLMDFIYEMDFSKLPNYKFNYPFDEMIHTFKYNELEELEEYSKYYLENKEEIIKLNWIYNNEIGLEG